MGRTLLLGAVLLLALSMLISAATAQSRVALVIGNGAYQTTAQLKTPTTDAAIVAETLRAAGYDVTELRDVHQADIGAVMRDFLDKLAGVGPEGVAFFYYSGHGAQFEGDNYLVPVDAAIASDADVADEAFRLNDLLDEVAKLPLAARIVVLDAARDHKFGVSSGKPVAQGLAMGDSRPGVLLVFSAAPGALAIDGDGDYSLFTGALVAMMRQPGLDMEQIVKATRLKVNQTTGGAQTPWMTSNLAVDVELFAPRDATPTPPPAGTRIPPKEEREVSKEMLRGLSPDEAYAVVLEEDTLEAYQWFVELYPRYPLAPQIWDTIETRREAVLWRRTLTQNTARAYWNYLKRYPNGAHADEARAQLAELSAAEAPPPDYMVTPEPLPPDYYDEAVGLVEVVPEGYDAPPSVFDVLAPIFIWRGERSHFDRARRFTPDRIPIVRGDPVRNFTSRDHRTNRDGRTTRDGRTVRDGRTGLTGTKKTGITGGKTNLTGTKTKTVTGTGTDTKTGTRTTTTTTPTGGRTGTKKTGVTIPTTGRTGRGTTTTTPTTIPGTRGGTTPSGTPGTRKTGVALPPSGTTTRGTPSGGTITGGPTIPGATPGVTTTRPTTPSGTVTTNRPGLPPVPGSTTGRPTTTTTTTPSTTTPGVTTGRPTTPTTVPTVSQRPGLPPVPSTATGRPTTTTTTTPTTPTTPTGRPTTPTVTSPTVHPATPTAHPTPPTVQAHPATPTVRPTTPTVHPTPQRPPPPTHAAPPPRPQPVTRAAPPPRPQPAARPAAPPPRPAAPPPRPPQRSCSMVNGKQVCK